jgi:hypothetical protein
MIALEAKASLLVHHPTKSNDEEVFGSASFMASVEAIIKSVKKDKTTAIVSCARMREDAFFDTFEISLTKQTIKTMPNQKGIDTFDTLVVSSNTQPIPVVKQTKLHKNLELMEFTLNTYCHNSATYVQWFEQLHQSTTKKRDGKILKPGWSQKTFDRCLKKLVEQGRITGGGDKGDCYSVLFTNSATLARQQTSHLAASPSPPSPTTQPSRPLSKEVANEDTHIPPLSTTPLQPNDPDGHREDDRDDFSPIVKSPGKITVTVIPLKGNDGNDGNPYCRLLPSNHRQNENDGNARESGTGSPEPVVTELLREVWEVLERSKRKS